MMVKKIRSRWCLVLVVLVCSVCWTSASEGFLAVFERESSFGGTSAPGAYGYSTLTLSEFSDVLCYSLVMEGLPPDQFIDIRLLRRDLHGESILDLGAEGQATHFRSGETGGCLGTLQPQDRAELRQGHLFLRVSNGASHGVEAEAQIVPVPSPRSLPAMSKEDWDLMAHWLELDQDQWGVLQSLLRMQPQQWRQLRDYLHEDGRAAISPTGVVYAVSPGSGAGGSPQFIVSPADLRTKVGTVSNKAGAAKSAVSSNAKSVVKEIELPRPEGIKKNLPFNRAMEED